MASQLNAIRCPEAQRRDDASPRRHRTGRVAAGGQIVIVLKFGGTSVGSAPSLENALQIVQAIPAGEAAVVVSALSGITDLLVRYASEPASRAELTDEFVDRHRALASQMGVDPAVFDSPQAVWRAECAAHASRGILRGAPRDRMLSFGERWSAILFAAALEHRGTAARAVEAGEAGLLTDEEFGCAHPLPEAHALLRESLQGVPHVPIVTGFTGRTKSGQTTTLGRGGSDFTAAILGAALGAREIQIWTDTSGMLTADPRVVPEARPVESLSFAEASELAYFGAKVLHPKTLLPAIERGIPVRILNTRDPEAPGSRITSESRTATDTWDIKSIALKRGITVVTVVSTRMLLAHGFLARVFEIFGRHRIVVDLVTTSEVSISMTLDDVTHLEAAIDELETIGRVSVQHNRALLAVVGEGAGSRVGLAGHIFSLLGGVGIGLEMISQGASHVNLSCVIDGAHANQAARLLHRGLGLDVPREERPPAPVPFPR
jgi:aspartate kinase